MDTRREIAQGLTALGVSASDDQITLLIKHLSMVTAANADFNLTRIDETDAVSLHVIDSCTALRHLESAPAGPFADIGSGAGYPGIPLCILSKRSATLVESVRKKAAFLERVVASLCLNASVRAVRAEELALEEPARYSAVTARAVSALPSLVELAAPLLREHGLLVCLKGDPGYEELTSARAAAALCGMLERDSTRVSIPGLDVARTIVVYERTGVLKTSLPRRPGLAQRRPFG